MSPQENFSLLRTVLKTFGLSQEATDDIIDRITDWLSEKDESKTPGKIEYPYHLRDDFLSAAEQSFYLVLKTSTADFALICPKVALGDLFYTKTNDQSKFRTYTNKIDRKHIDYLLCDPKTVRPILGFELDDKSHQRRDRQERDEFVGKVFAAAKLPLIRIPVKQSYTVSELTNILQPYFADERTSISQQSTTPAITTEAEPAPLCPKCNSKMFLRTAKSGANSGERFWGCSNYPQCRGILKYTP